MFSDCISVMLLYIYYTLDICLAQDELLYYWLFLLVLPVGSSMFSISGILVFTFCNKTFCCGHIKTTFVAAHIDRAALTTNAFL